MHSVRGECQFLDIKVHFFVSHQLYNLKTDQMYDLVIENPQWRCRESERLKQRMRKFASLLYEHVTHLSIAVKQRN